MDGLLGVQQIAADRPHRISRFLTALANELRLLKVTTFYRAETRNLIGGVIEGLTIGLSTIAENLILLRYVELRSRLRRLISIVRCGTAISNHRCGSSASPLPALKSPVRSTAPRPSSAASPN